MATQDKKLIYTDNTALGFPSMSPKDILKLLKNQPDIRNLELILDKVVHADSVQQLLNKLEDTQPNQEQEFELSYELDDTKIFLHKYLEESSKPAFGFSVLTDSLENLDNLHESMLKLCNDYIKNNSDDIKFDIHYSANYPDDIYATMQDRAVESLNESYLDNQARLNDLPHHFTIYGMNTRGELLFTPDNPDNPHNSLLQTNINAVLDEGNLSGDKPSMGVISMSGNPRNRFSVNIDHRENKNSQANENNQDNDNEGNQPKYDTPFKMKPEGPNNT